MRRQRSRVHLLVALALAAQIPLGCRAAPRALAPSPSPSQDPATLPPAPAPTATTTVTATAPSATSTPVWSTPSTPAQSEQEKAPATTQARPEGIRATLDSLRQVDDYPLYTMRYYGAYHEAASWAGGKWVGLPPSSNWACSLFAALGDPDGLLYGRNFDWQYSPALLLFTDPPDAYASVSMVDLAYLIPPRDASSPTDLDLEERTALLTAPFWPFDGMNEHGLVVGMAAVPQSELPYDPDKETIDSLLVIREMLDHARDVDEAVAILASYNITWDGGPALHYLIADASGDSILVEFFAGDTVLVPGPTGSPWHAATNHLRAALADDGASSGCWRYDEISRRLTETEGRLAVPDALDLLTDVAQDNTQWSVVYDLSARRLTVAMGGDYDSLHEFCLRTDGLTSCPDGD